MHGQVNIHQHGKNLIEYRHAKKKRRNKKKREIEKNIHFASYFSNIFKHIANIKTFPKYIYHKTKKRINNFILQQIVYFIIVKYQKCFFCECQ